MYRRVVAHLPMLALAMAASGCRAEAEVVAILGDESGDASGSADVPPGAPMTGPFDDCVQLPASSAVFDVTAFGARGDGVTDDTAAIQAALDAAARSGSRAVVFVPNGSYVVSDSLRLDGTPLDDAPRAGTTVQGQCRDHTRIVVPVDTIGFSGSQGERKPVLGSGATPALDDGIYNLSIEIADDNARAIPVQLGSRRRASLYAVTITGPASHPQCAIDVADASGSVGLHHVTVTGFAAGLCPGTTGGGIVGEHVTFEGSRLAVGNEGRVLTVRDLQVLRSADGVRNSGETAAGVVTLVDARFHAEPAQDGAPFADFGFSYLRDVTIDGYSRAVDRDDDTVGLPLPAEYLSAPAHGLFEPLAVRSLGLDIAETPVIPRSDERWASPEDFGADPSGASDATAALQAAADSGATAIALSFRARYRVDGDLRLGGDVRRVVGGTLVGRGSVQLGDVRGNAAVLEHVGLEQSVVVYAMASTPWVLRDVVLAEPGLSSAGSGDLFLEGVHGSLRFENPAQSIWGRQLSGEGESPHLFNRGAELWGLGVDTRGGNGVAETLGGRTELLGVSIVEATGATAPMFRTVDAATAYVGVGETSTTGSPYSTIVEETRASTLRSLPASMLPARNGGARLVLFAGFAP